MRERVRDRVCTPFPASTVPVLLFLGGVHACTCAFGHGAGCPVYRFDENNNKKKF